MSKSKNRVRYTVIILCALAATIFGLYIGFQWHAHQPIDKRMFHGTLLDEARVIQPFELTGTDKQPFSNANLVNQWTLLFFGFTHCGYMCPTTMAELGKTYRLLEQRGATVLPRVVMITLDPERDDLDRLNHYVKSFDQHFYGARGDASTIHAMTRDMGIAYAKIARTTQDGKDQDDIEHTGAIMLVNPQGRLVAFFTNPHDAKDIADDFLLLTKGKATS